MTAKEVAQRAMDIADEMVNAADETPVVAVTPQTAAFPDRTCFYGRYPLESFCFVLTQERG